MPETINGQNQLKDKIHLTLRVNYIASALVFLFSIICYFFLNIKEIIPFVFLGFSVLSLTNVLAFKKHENIILTYNLASILAILTIISVTVYSGGINSPFIFVITLIVFAGYATGKKHSRIYLRISLLIIALIFGLDYLPTPFTENVVPSASRNIFSLLSVLLSVYLLGGVFGKIILNTHHRLYKSKREIENRIDEKENLLKEVHHRVKNNLQTVSSLLSLQSRSIKDEKIRSLIKSSQNRVTSMAMIHEMLYMRDEYLSRIAYKSYVLELSEYLVRSIKGTENNISLKIDIPDIKLNIDTAIPLGLLINEAVTNSLKYGIKDDEKGEILIALKEEGKGYVLHIGDNGIGFCDSINPKTTESLGLKLIYNLARQLKGSVERKSSDKGTNYIVAFEEIGEQGHLI
ncbi:MAG: sensor histidine kinase [Cellulophaga sp.]